MFRTIFGTKQFNLPKNGKKNKRKQTIACFGLVEENMELSHIHLAVCLILMYLLSDSMAFPEDKSWHSSLDQSHRCSLMQGVP